MDDRPHPVHPGNGGPGDHREHLEQGPADRLAEETDGDQVGHGQGRRGPARGQDLVA